MTSSWMRLRLSRYLKREPGADRVAAVAEGARVSAVTIAEVVTWLTVEGVQAESAYTALNLFRLTVEPFRSRTCRCCGISGGENAGIAVSRLVIVHVSRSRSNWACRFMTGDRAWRDLDIGVDVRLFR